MAMKFIIIWNFLPQFSQNILLKIVFDLLSILNFFQFDYNCKISLIKSIVIFLSCNCLFTQNIQSEHPTICIMFCKNEIDFISDEESYFNVQKL